MVHQVRRTWEAQGKDELLAITMGNTIDMNRPNG
jgi:hypothetical protein